jgi:hypothetical protein
MIRGEMSKKRHWESRSNKDFPKEWHLGTTSQGAYLTKYVFNAKLEKLEKLYLCYVAAMSKFDERRPCFASRDEMLNALSMVKATHTKTKKKLIELGWIVVYGREGTSDLQFPAIGKDDPNFKWKVPERKEGR